MVQFSIMPVAHFHWKRKNIERIYKSPVSPSASTVIIQSPILSSASDIHTHKPCQQTVLMLVQFFICRHSCEICCLISVQIGFYFLLTEVWKMELIGINLNRKMFSHCLFSHVCQVNRFRAQRHTSSERAVWLNNHLISEVFNVIYNIVTLCAFLSKKKSAVTVRNMDIFSVSWGLCGRWSASEEQVWMGEGGGGEAKI